MKRFVLLLMVFLLILLPACSSQSAEPYVVEKNGIEYTVDQRNGTISDGEYTYQFQIHTTPQGIQTTITYPDGSTYWLSSTENLGHVGWSDDYDASPDSPYSSGETLVSIAETRQPIKIEGTQVFISLILAALSIWYIVSPRSAWYLSYGWVYKGAEPSDAALVIARISGVVLLIFALIILFI